MNTTAAHDTRYCIAEGAHRAIARHPKTECPVTILAEIDRRIADARAKEDAAVKRSGAESWTAAFYMGRVTGLESLRNDLLRKGPVGE